MLDPWMDWSSSVMSEFQSIEVAASMFLASIEENATPACFELGKSSARSILFLYTGVYIFEMLPVCL